MDRPLLFCDLAGTLEVQDPDLGMATSWPGAREALADLARDHDLHLATGDSYPGAVTSLGVLGLRPFFRELHAGLPGGGKPFGALAAAAGRRPERCIVLGDDPVADTAADSEVVVSLIVVHRPRLVPADRVLRAIRAMAHGDGFFGGFVGLVGDRGRGGAVRWADLPPVELAGPARAGWWNKPGTGPRPVVELSG
jgi:hypothetical protein